MGTNTEEFFPIVIEVKDWDAFRRHVGAYITIVANGFEVPEEVWEIDHLLEAIDVEGHFYLDRVTLDEESYMTVKILFTPGPESEVRLYFNIYFPRGGVHTVDQNLTTF